jgi:hypothetical protein
MSTKRRPDREDRQLDDGAVNSGTRPPVERAGQTQARSGLTRDSTFLGSLLGAAATPPASEPRPSTPTVPDRAIVACESETWLLPPRTLSQLAWEKGRERARRKDSPTGSDAADVQVALP